MEFWWSRAAYATKQTIIGSRQVATQYGLTDSPPFKNILPTIGNEQSQLEMAVVVAILVYALIGWVLARLMMIVFFRDVTVARRGFF